MRLAAVNVNTQQLRDFVNDPPSVSPTLENTR